MTEYPRLPDNGHQIRVSEKPAYVYVRAANGVFPPRVEYNDIKRKTALVPVDRIREFADTLDAESGAKLRALLDALAPWAKDGV